MEKLEDKSILLSWKTIYSKVGLNVLFPQPPLPPPKKKMEKNKKKIKKRKQAIPAMCYLFHLSPQVVDVL